MNTIHESFFMSKNVVWKHLLRCKGFGILEPKWILEIQGENRMRITKKIVAAFMCGTVAVSSLTGCGFHPSRVLMGRFICKQEVNTK